jgi:hypothetical protein
VLMPEGTATVESAAAGDTDAPHSDASSREMTSTTPQQRNNLFLGPRPPPPHGFGDAQGCLGIGKAAFMACKAFV